MLRKKAWLPLAGGLALLGFIGAGEHSDLTAHAFGFTAGIGLGILFESFFHNGGKETGGIKYWVISILMVAGAWVAPIFS